jgi:hypothetical protein
MIFWVLCLFGWIALWFRPKWRWLVVAGLIVALPGPILAVLAFGGSDFPMANLLQNAFVSFITGFATFAVPAAAIVLLRQRFMSGAKE